MGANAIIRPPRYEYDINSLPNEINNPYYGIIPRHSISFENSKKQKIVGSFFAPREEIPEMSCIIYLHGNASSQHEGMFLVPIFIPYGVAVLTFDFSGCGLSDGQYVSLGYFERDDVTCAIEFVRKNFNVGRVALWGRSMGAATTLYALADDPTISAAVIDSPFASLPDLVKEIAARVHVPGFLASIGKSLIAKKIKELANFDISKLVPIEVASSCFSPVRFVHGEQDDFISKTHSEKIFEKYSGEDKEIFIVPGKHNSRRPLDTELCCIMFLANYLNAPLVYEEVVTTLSGGASYQHFENVEEMMFAMEGE